MSTETPDHKKSPEASREAPLRGFATSEPATGLRRHRLNLPTGLDEQFEQLHELSSAGGQATLLMCQRRDSTHEQVVVKMYDKPASPGQEDLRPVLKNLASPHIIKYRDPNFGSDDGYWWEVIEYCQGGTLQEFAAESGGKITPAQGVEVVRQVHEALSSIHSASPQIVHRDIKPTNIMLRSRDPIDAVLIDFGFAVEVTMSREYRSGSRTVPYAAPEAIGGETGPSLDWWGLGMTMLEMFSGEHPFRLPDGRFMSEGKINSHLSSRAIPIPELEDPRLTTLLRGLLTRDPTLRWGAKEVEEWLNGGTPLVADDVEPDTLKRAPVAATVTDTPVEFAGALYTDPVVLAHAMAHNWNEAGRKVVSSTFNEIVDWTERFYPERSLEAVAQAARERNYSVDLTVANVIANLDPDCVPVFMGERVDLPALPSLATRAVSEGETLITLLEKLFSSRALRAFGQLKNHRDLLLVDSRWADNVESAKGWFTSVPEAGGFKPEHLAVFLLSAVEQVSGAGDG